jgi:hypothetical protein
MITEDSKKVITAIGKVKDFTELTPANLKIFSKAIVAVNEFNKKMTHYGQKIFEKHLKSLEEWNQYLSEADWKEYKTKITNDNHYEAYVRCFVTGSMTKYWRNKGWSMGDATELKTTYKFSDDGKMLTVYNNWKTKSARFSHIPWVPRERRFVITLNTGKVEVEGENINTER